MQGGTSQISRRSSKVSLSHFSLAGISLLPSILGDFLVIFFKRFGTKRVKANNVYQEYIQDKNHLHMNATRWVTLTEFIKYLDEQPQQRERLLIAEQIERAEREAREKGEGTSAAGVVEGEEKKQEEGLQREEGEKGVLAFSASLHLHHLRQHLPRASNRILSS
jgi:Domain of Kin17 curved DNA-binding protein